MTCAICIYIYIINKLYFTNFLKYNYIIIIFNNIFFFNFIKKVNMNFVDFVEACKILYNFNDK